MAVYGVSVTKSRGWRGATEKWANVYHYSMAANLDAAQAANLVDQIATAEKLIHSDDIVFEDGRVWEVGGTPADNETIVIRDLSGTGSAGIGGTMNVELTAVARCDTNRNTNTGRRIYLRKYYHTCVLASGTSLMYASIAALTATQKNPIQTCLESLREVTLTPGSVLVTLCAPGGQQVSDSRPVSVLDYLHVRQFRR